MANLPRLLLVFLLPAIAAAQNTTADLVVINANVRTMDRDRPRAEAIAVKGDKISAVGMNREIRRLIGPETEIIDARGRLVLPGFNDSHVHFIGTGNQFFSVDLSQVRTPAEIVDRIKLRVRFLPAGQWILGSGWNHENWTPAALPAKELIDAVTPAHPVLIYNSSAQMALVNSRSLKLAGIDKRTKDPAGGEIVRDEKGEPTGVLIESAIRLVRRFVPASVTANTSALAETATNYAASLGVTSVQDMQTDDNVALYREMVRLNKLKTRIYDCIDLVDWARLAGAGIKRATGDGMVRTGCLKNFSEGDLESTSPLYRHVLAADKADLQVMMHAIGPRANDAVLSIFERVAKENGAKDRRFRIEHAHNFRPEDLKRFSETNVIASAQPFLFLGGAAPYRTMLDRSVALALGSDSSMSDLNPLKGIHAAVNGGSEARLTIEEAVRAYTLGSAYAEFQEHVKGSITAGKLADLVILSADIFAVQPVEILETRVLTTIVDGKVVYQLNSTGNEN